MLDYIKIINFRYGGQLSGSEIARLLGCSPSGVNDFLRSFDACDELTYPLPAGITNRSIHDKVYVGQGRRSDDTFVQPNFEEVHDAMHKRKNMTLKYQWNQYRRRCQNSGLKPYSYRQFCKLYGDWCTTSEITFHFEPNPGEQMEVDFAGQTFELIDRVAGETRPVVVFVAVLPYSNYTYAEGMLSTKEAEWIEVNNHALEYFGGVPAIVVPDNCKQAVLVNKDWIDPDLNPAYEEWAAWNGTCILPSKVKRPTYKGSVEQAVGFLEKGVFHYLAELPFFNLEDFNQRLWAELEKLNRCPFSKKEHNRLWYFEKERDALRPLPPQPFELAECRQGKVHSDCHVRFDSVCYSVDFRYANQTVQIRATADRVRIYTMEGELIADWDRAFERGKWCTNPDHLPSWLKEMNSESVAAFLQKARTIGPNTESVLRLILDSCSVPVQGFRRCHGLLGFAGKHGEEALEECCRQALAAGRHNYRYIKDTIESVAEELEEKKLAEACRQETVLRAQDSSVDALLARTAALVQKGGASE